MYYTTLFIVSLMYSYGFLFKRRFLYWRDKRGHSALFFSKKHFEMEKKFLGNPIYTKYVHIHIQVQNLNFVKYFKN